MTTGRRRAEDSQADELLSWLYQQVNEEQAARFAAGYDMAAGLARYRAWLGEHTAEEQARPPAEPTTVLADSSAGTAATLVPPGTSKGSPSSARIPEEKPMTTLPGFTVDIDQNPYLPVGGREVSAIVTVTADQGGGAPSPGGAPGEGNAEIIIIDCSGSMDYPPTKMTEARAATAAAIDVLRDGTRFAVVAGTSTAWPVYPGDGSMAVAGERTRAEAKAALRTLRASGGTAIGEWLRLAERIFAASPAALRHAILLTDGKNQHETPEQLAAAISACEGVFRCDCRGVGTDWEVAELRKVSTALLGSVDIVVDPAGLAADFAKMMGEAMSK